MRDSTVPSLIPHMSFARNISLFWFFFSSSSSSIFPIFIPKRFIQYLTQIKTKQETNAKDKTMKVLVNKVKNVRKIMMHLFHNNGFKHQIGSVLNLFLLSVYISETLEYIDWFFKDTVSESHPLFTFLFYLDGSYCFTNSKICLRNSSSKINHYSWPRILLAHGKVKETKKT